MSVRVAAIDCGTNSIRLLIADVDPESGALVDVERRMEVVRLGQGVDRTGEISAAAMARTLTATGQYADLVARAAATSVRFVATSASRDARNADEFVAGVRELIGVEPEVVTGADEAALSFAGATGGLPAGHRPPFVVVDLGGGSTEVVLGADGTVEAALSVDIGCVRLSERHLHGDPPTVGELTRARADVDRALDLVAGQVPLARARSLVGVAGTVTTVTAHVLGLPRYDPAIIHGATLPVADVLAACAELVAMPRAARTGLPYMHPGRVDVIAAGALIWGQVVERVAAVADVTQVVASEHDILDGIALDLARRSSHPPL